MNLRVGSLIMLLLCPPAALCAPAEPPAAPVVVKEVVRLPEAAMVSTTGTVHPRNEMQVTAGIDGRIVLVPAPGTRVRRGEPLLRIETESHMLRLAELEAQADRARAQLEFLDSKLARQRGLESPRAIAAHELDQTRSQRDMAASDLRIAEVRSQQVSADMERATVFAEFDCVVSARLRREGEEVSRGAVVAHVIDTERLEVRVPMRLQHSARVTEGDVLRVRASGREVDATVRHIVPDTDPRRQSVELRLDLPASPRWTVGELVSVELPLLAEAGVLTVPEDALVLRQEGAYVFRIANDSVAERIAVQVAEGRDGYIAVSGAGLAPGDKVVVRGGETLGPGQRVTLL